MKLLALAILALLLAGCQHETAVEVENKPGTPELSRDISQHANAAGKALSAAMVDVAKLPESFLKGTIQTNLRTAQGEVAEVVKGSAATEAQAQADAERIAAALKKIEQLKADDPVLRWLRLAAIGLILLGATLVALHFLWLKLEWGDDAGGVCLLVGGICWTIVVYEGPIKLTLLVCIVAGGIWMVWNYWRQYRKSEAKS